MKQTNKVVNTDFTAVKYYCVTAKNSCQIQTKGLGFCEMVTNLLLILQTEGMSCGKNILHSASVMTLFLFCIDAHS